MNPDLPFITLFAHERFGQNNDVLTLDQPVANNVTAFYGIVHSYNRGGATVLSKVRVTKIIFLSNKLYSPYTVSVASSVSLFFMFVQFNSSTHSSINPTVVYWVYC